MSTTAYLIGVGLTAVVGTTTVTVTMDGFEDVKSDAIVVAEAAVVGDTIIKHWLVEDFTLPQSLTCATDPCTSFAEVPELTVTGQNTITYTVLGADDFAVTATNMETGESATYDSRTGSKTQVGE